jgi:transporter family-2 protein
MGIITAAINGANGLLADQIGLFQSVVIIHVIGTVISILYYLLLDKKDSGKVINLLLRKPLLFTGGAIGAFAVVSISFAVQNIGVFLVSTALIVGQFIFSFVIDLKGWFGFEKLPLTKEKISALALMAAGVFLLLI